MTSEIKEQWLHYLKGQGHTEYLEIIRHGHRTFSFQILVSKNTCDHDNDVTHWDFVKNGLNTIRPKNTFLSPCMT